MQVNNLKNLKKKFNKFQNLWLNQKNRIKKQKTLAKF